MEIDDGILRDVVIGGPSARDDQLHDTDAIEVAIFMVELAKKEELRDDDSTIEWLVGA